MHRETTIRILRTAADSLTLAAIDELAAGFPRTATAFQADAKECRKHAAELQREIEQEGKSDGK